MLTPSQATKEVEQVFLVETKQADDPEGSGQEFVPESLVLDYWPWLEGVITDTDFWHLEFCIDLTWVRIESLRCDTCGRTVSECEADPENCKGDLPPELIINWEEEKYRNALDDLGV